MRHFRRFLICLLCILMLTTVVYADSATKSVRNYSVVAPDGSCSVSLTVTVSLDTPASGMTFPLPAGANGVTMNGSSVRTYPSATSNAVIVDLSELDGIMGEYPMNFNYTISSVLETVDKRLIMNLPLLSGFDYPVQSLEFSITMPGEVTGNPSFSSGYLNNSIESLLTWDVVGYTITGSSTGAFQDRETLTMSMQVSEDMFPGQLFIPREGNPELVYMGISAAVALLYWLLMMRCLPILRQHQTTPIEGLTAGEIGSRLSSAGVDLTMMVFTWAQLGYVQIHPDKYGRVKLEKRMDMGNERTEFENRCFRALFAHGSTADGTGTGYARLCRKVALTVSGAHEMYRRRSGNVKIFRAINCCVSLFCGICFGMNIAGSRLWQILLSILLAVVGVITAWGIQDGMYRFHIRGKTSQYIGTVCMVVWLALGAAAGLIWAAVAAVAAQMIAGLAAAYGGRRSELGRHQASQILGLRRYLKTVPRDELERILENNPDYFFDMLPFAIALGVDGPFARQFGDLDVYECAYLTVRQDRRRTAQDWARLLRKTADKLDKRQRKMQLDRWTLVSLNFSKLFPQPQQPPKRTAPRRRR